MAKKTTEAGTRDLPLTVGRGRDAQHPNRHERPGSGHETADVVAISSTLISASETTVLVDTFITVEQADILARIQVAASSKNLTTIYVTHGHGDNFFGIGALLDRFPIQGGAHAAC